MVKLDKCKSRLVATWYVYAEHCPSFRHKKWLLCSSRLFSNRPFASVMSMDRSRLPPLRPWPSLPGSWGPACSRRAVTTGDVAGPRRWLCYVLNAASQTSSRIRQHLNMRQNTGRQMRFIFHSLGTHVISFNKVLCHTPQHWSDGRTTHEDCPKRKRAWLCRCDEESSFLALENVWHSPTLANMSLPPPARLNAMSYTSLSWAINWVFTWPWTRFTLPRTWPVCKTKIQFWHEDLHPLRREGMESDETSWNRLTFNLRQTSYF